MTGKQYRPVATRKAFTVTLTAAAPVASANLVCDNGWTHPGEAIYAVGNVPALGSWDTVKAVKLSPNVYWEYLYNPPPNYDRNTAPGAKSPKWTEVVSGLPPASNVEWKCVKKTASGWQYMQGGNRKFNTPKTGFAGTSVATF